MWWSRLLLLPLMVSALSPPEEEDDNINNDDKTTVCDEYVVELRAVFDNDTVIPCTETETSIIEALIHSLVQTDAIVGLNRIIPVAPFYLAFEELGPNSTRLSSNDQIITEFDMTQMEMATDHLNYQDHLEDLYYDSGYIIANNDSDTDTTNGNNTISISTTTNKNSTDMDMKGDDSNEEADKVDDKLTLTPPPPVQLAGGSLRQGPNGRQRRRNLRGRSADASSRSSSARNLQGDIDTSAPTPVPTTVPSNVPSQSSSEIPTLSPSDAPTSPPNETPSASPSQSPSAVPSSSLPSQSPSAVPSSSFPSQSPSAVPSSSFPSQSPSAVPSQTPSSTPSSSPSNVPTTSSPSHPPSSSPTSETPSATPSWPSELPSSEPSKSPSQVPTPNPTVSPTTDYSLRVDCDDADWCAWFFTKPCDEIPHYDDEDPNQLQAELIAFQNRVKEQIEKKLRKWARDTNVMCLGNSWQLQAFVKELL